MLAARRDPVFDHGPHDPSPAPPPVHAGGHAASRPTGFARFIAGVQILGTVLGIPLGLASGYSIYRANFSPEAKCGSLRASIIAMLDKNADATTLRLLVRRDVTTFERSCAAVDPDAVAAFKTLLAKPRAVAAAKEAKPAEPVKHASVAPERRVAHAEDTKREDAKREETKHVVAKLVTKPADKTDKAVPVRHDADADWLAAVRRALVAHGPVTRAQAAEAPVSLAAPRALSPMGAPLPAPPQAAPALPPPTAIADAPAPQGDESHPVPPAPIPNVGLPPAR